MRGASSSSSGVGSRGAAAAGPAKAPIGIVELAICCLIGAFFMTLCFVDVAMDAHFIESNDWEFYGDYYRWKAAAPYLGLVRTLVTLWALPTGFMYGVMEGLVGFTKKKASMRRHVSDLLVLIMLLALVSVDWLAVGGYEKAIRESKGADAALHAIAVSMRRCHLFQLFGNVVNIVLPFFRLEEASEKLHKTA